jgi:hypothetical protein
MHGSGVVAAYQREELAWSACRARMAPNEELPRERMLPA